MQKYRVIVADPPWPFSDKLKMSDVKRGAEANYSVMSISDIQQLPMKNFTHKDGAILALWVPSSLLQEGLDTMKAWGFAHKQTYVWVKTKKIKNVKQVFFKTAREIYKDLVNQVPVVQVFENFSLNLQGALAFGMGRLFRQTHEICLIGTSNNKIYKKLKNKSQRSVCMAENLRHSAKPDDLQESLELMFPKTKKLELFARRHRPGWTCLGNEICNGEDIRDSLAKL